MIGCVMNQAALTGKKYLPPAVGWLTLVAESV
jgi:hypothetical protein